MTNRGGQEDLFNLELATGEIRQLTNDAARARGEVRSPDGAKLFFYSQRDEDRYEIWSINADGSNLTRITHSKGRSLWYPTVSPDGKLLACFNDEHTYLLDLTRPGAELEELPGSRLGSRPSFNAWSPNSRMLAGELRGRPGLLLYSLDDREYTPLTSSGTRPIWLPGGQEILFSDTGRLRVVNIVTKEIRDIATSAPVTGMSLSADAKTLVYSDRLAEADIWMAEMVAER
jgi:TolB protein